MKADARVTSRPFLCFSRRSLLAAVLSISCCFSLGFDPGAFALAAPGAVSQSFKLDPALKGLPITDLSAEEATTHALNRLAYGPRPGDIERIKQMGLAKWIDQQLNPSSIDDRTVDVRLQNYPTLRMSSATLIADYPRPKQAAKKGELSREQAAERRAEVAEMKQKESSSVSSDVDSASTSSESTDVPSPMKQDPSMQGGSNIATRGLSQRDALNANDPNAVPRAIADDSRRPQRVVEELAMA